MASSLNLIYVNGGGSRDKKGRKKEKEGRGFGRLPSFFFPPFLFVFTKLFFSTSDFGPNLVVFFVFWGFDYFRILEIFHLNSLMAETIEKTFSKTKFCINKLLNLIIIYSFSEIGNS